MKRLDKSLKEYDWSIRILMGHHWEAVFHCGLHNHLCISLEGRLELGQGCFSYALWLEEASECSQRCTAIDWKIQIHFLRMWKFEFKRLRYTPSATPEQVNMNQTLQPDAVLDNDPSQNAISSLLAVSGGSERGKKKFLLKSTCFTLFSA